MNRLREYVKESAVYHLLIGLLLIVPHGLSSLYIANQTNLAWYFLNILILDGEILFILYATFYYLIPSVWRKGKYVLYYSLLALFILMYVFSAVALSRYFQARVGGTNSISYFDFVLYLSDVVRYIIIAFLLYSLKEREDQKKKLKEMALEKLRTEVNYLRAQINPHFLFNTLNNLYGLAVQKSDRTPDVIIKLSKMMEYMLHELNGSKVLLERDVQYLRDYVEIEKIRFRDHSGIEFRSTGSIDTQIIEPLLLLPLVENAFKHGMSTLSEGGFVTIDLHVSRQLLNFKVCNSYKAGDRHKSSGSGLTNLQRRLQLFYPGVHSLRVTNSGGVHEAVLTLNLT